MKRAVLLLIMSAAFAAVGFVMAATGERALGSAVGFFFAGCACVFGGQLVGARENVEANQRRAASLTADFAIARGRTSLTALGGGLMGAGSGLMSAVGAPEWLGWFGLIGGVMCFLGLAPKTFDRRAQLSFNTYGVTWPRMFSAPLPWTAIAAISLSPAGVELHAAEGAPNPKPTLFGAPKRVILTDHLLDGDLPAILGAIHRFHPTIRVSGAERPTPT